MHITHNNSIIGIVTVADVLTNVTVPEMSQHVSQTSGLDSRSKCLDVRHFDNYPHTVKYNYNSRGFRDAEWPGHDQLRSAIWCLGDSFTAGIGSPLEHTWPQVLAQESGQRTINVSMDGASNAWIARQCVEVYLAVQPRNMVVMWSYLHRRESSAAGSDQARRLHYVKSTIAQDYENFVSCRDLVKQHVPSANLIEMIIPNWQPVLTQATWDNIRDQSWPKSVLELTPKHQAIINELTSFYKIHAGLLNEQLMVQPAVFDNVIQVPQLDQARDGHHFDIITSRWISAELVSRLR